MIQFVVNNTQFTTKGGISVIEACELVGIEIPRFCYHQNLSVAGNCRMCLVEVANSPKPVASCALPVLNNMKIFVNSPLVKKARENVLEMLLINHPLDCPICDQGGECDLQDQSRTFGVETSRFFFKKRSVENKEFGSLIRTIMTRCIHCTRCVRFNAEISGGEIFGTLNRGTTTEIGPYKSSVYNSEVSANVIDLCPVGALTSSSYAFKARPWETLNIESIDLSDGLGSNVYVSVKEAQVLRVFPRPNKQSDDNFISDRARFYFDCVKNNRLINSGEKSLDIKKFFSLKKVADSKKKVLLLSNASADLDSLFLLKGLERLNTDEISVNLYQISPAITKSNTFISWSTGSVSDINLSHDICLIIASNPRIETPLINTKINVKQTLSHSMTFGFSLFSEAIRDLKFTSLNLSEVCSLFEGKTLILSLLFNKSKKPLVIFNENLIKRGLENNVLKAMFKAIHSNIILIKTSTSSNILGSEILNINRLNTRVLQKNLCNHFIAINLDDSNQLSKTLNLLKSEICLWLNTHKSEIISPLLSKTLICLKTIYEEENTYVNLEEKVQKTTKIVPSLPKLISSKSFVKSLEDFSFSSSDIKAKAERYKGHADIFLELKEKADFMLQERRDIMYMFDLGNIWNRHSFNCVSMYPTKMQNEDLYMQNKELNNSKVTQIKSLENRNNSINLLHKIISDEKVKSTSTED